MPNKIDKETYKCLFCEFTSQNYYDVYQHELGEHEMVYVPLSLDDLNRLNSFLLFKDDRLLTDTLVSTIRNYLKTNIKRKRFGQLEGEY